MKRKWSGRNHHDDYVGVHVHVLRFRRKIPRKTSASTSPDDDGDDDGEDDANGSITVFVFKSLRRSPGSHSTTSK